MRRRNPQRALNKVLLITIFCYFLPLPVLAESPSLTATSETGQAMRELRFLKPQNGEDVVIQIEVADTPSTRAAGLQDRTGLEQDKGMLFVFPAEAQLKFWMEKTLIPLDIIYVSEDFKIVDIIPDAQPCRESPCTIYPSRGKCRYAIEVNAGFTKINHINVGDKVVF
jgi:uncharacterized membrane protein (UPF0127 family)